MEAGRVRRAGGGRLAIDLESPELNAIFLSVIESHIAGLPNKEVRWVKLTQAEIVEKLRYLGYNAGRNVVRKLLKKHKFVKRKMSRCTSTGKSKFREPQFTKIDKLKKEFNAKGLPYFSIDTKKKEQLGDLYREGSVYTTRAIEVYDHDYSYLSTGKIVPHGIYDIKKNHLHINYVNENETAGSVCYSIRVWWNTIGKQRYPDLPELLLFCDAGGANSYRHHIFKVELQKLADETGMPIRIAHYPPYTSKWNPIEHRAFPHVTRALEGVPLHTVEQAKQLTKNAKTKTGFKTSARVIKRKFEKGIRATKEMVRDINIFFDKKIPQLNYVVRPMDF